MKQKFETVIVLPHLVMNDGSPSYLTRDRLDRSICLYEEGVTNTITTCGNRLIGNEKYTYAEAMRLYILGKGVDESVILKEEESLDTVGQAIFTKIRIVNPNNWKRLIAVSSDYHMKRVKQLFDFIYGKGYEIEYEGANSHLINDTATLNKEEESLRAFFEMFGDIIPGDDEKMINRLYEKHNLYKRLRMASG